MRRFAAPLGIIYVLALFLAITDHPASSAQGFDGRQIFRFDTFGDEQLWTKELRMHEVIPSVSPQTALAVGLKVDVEALPPTLIAAVQAGQVDPTDPGVTVELLRLNAVVGVIGGFNGQGNLASIGITCALCHSTVDNSFMAGIGRRLDGWPNRDLDVGTIVGLSPVIPDDAFSSWGPGKYDPRDHAFDGKNIITLNSPTRPVLIPPAYGLLDVPFETYTADGSVSYWNNYVGVSQMGGQGSFNDPRIGLTITQKPDLVAPKLAALRDYQLSLLAPTPPDGSFDAAAATRGERLFHGKARCGSCHQPPAYTDVSSGSDPTIPLLHAPGETGMEPVYASRSATKIGYRTAPLRGIWQHPPYFHDGSAADLLAVVNHYDTVLLLHLSANQRDDLVEFLKSL